MHQSYVVQQAKQKLGTLRDWTKQAGSRGSEEAVEKWSVVKEKSSKVSKILIVYAMYGQRFKFSIFRGCDFCVFFCGLLLCALA